MFAQFYVVALTLGFSRFSVAFAGAACSRSYTIKEGDFCNGISNNQNVSTFQFFLTNPSLTVNDCNNLPPGQHICLGYPGGDCTDTQTVNPEDTCQEIADQNKLSLTTLVTNNPQLVNNPQRMKNRQLDSENACIVYPGEVLCISNKVYVLPSSGAPPPPSITSTPPPSATSAPPPSATGAPPPSATDAPSPSATDAPPPSATDSPPPSATDAPPPSATSAPPPSATSASPPSTTSAPPPSTTRASPPSTTSTSVSSSPLQAGSTMTFPNPSASTLSFSGSVSVANNMIIIPTLSSSTSSPPVTVITFPSLPT